VEAGRLGTTGAAGTGGTLADSSAVPGTVPFGLGISFGGGGVPVPGAPGKTTGGPTGGVAHGVAHVSQAGAQPQELLCLWNRPPPRWWPPVPHVSQQVGAGAQHGAAATGAGANTGAAGSPVRAGRRRPAGPGPPRTCRSRTRRPRRTRGGRGCRCGRGGGAWTRRRRRSRGGRRRGRGGRPRRSHNKSPPRPNPSIPPS